MPKLPLSKSIALRALILNEVSRLLGNGCACIPELPDAEDIEGLQRGLEAFRRMTEGASGSHCVHIGEGGAPLRFFTALAASTPGVDITVSAGKSLRRRPLALLLDALRGAGADIRCLRREGYPPLHIIGTTPDPGPISINPGVSSQFVSALMMVAPLWADGLRLGFEGSPAVSAPYLHMTGEVMRAFGGTMRMANDGITVEGGKCHAPARFEIESDWSAASYLYEIALLLPGRAIYIDRLTPPQDSLQGDARCAGIFHIAGVDTEWHPDGSATLRCDASVRDRAASSQAPLELDMGGTPDLVPALAVGFCLAGIRFRLTGVSHLRYKESDRLQSLACELEKIGFMADAGTDTLSWTGRRCPTGENETIDTWRDHRIAMAFAPAAIRLPYVAVDDTRVTAKSWPAYWETLEGLGFRLRRFGHGASITFSKK